MRDQLLERQERHYQQMIGEAFARSERVGELEAENRQLRQLLPPDTDERPPKAQPPFSFTPRSVVEQGDNPGESPAAERYNHGYGRQWPEASA